MLYIIVWTSAKQCNNVDVGLVWIGNENIIQGQNNFSIYICGYSRYFGCRAVQLSGQ